MRRGPRLPRVLVAIAIAASSLPFFTDPAIAGALPPIDPRPGSWAEYLVRTRGEKDVRVRATVLPAEGERRYWLELTAVGESGIAFAARMLIDGERWPANVRRMYVMLAGQQPVAIPVDRIRLPLPRSAARAAIRIWRDDSVPLWGIVKARSSRGSVELLGCGVLGGHSVFPPAWDQGNGSESANR
jgi:hypothetical protein